MELNFICAETGFSKYICKQTRLSCFGEGFCIVQYFYIKPIKRLLNAERCMKNKVDHSSVAACKVW